jgi:hypothetical protein
VRGTRRQGAIDKDDGAARVKSSQTKNTGLALKYQTLNFKIKLQERKPPKGPGTVWGFKADIGGGQGERLRWWGSNARFVVGRAAKTKLVLEDMKG